LNHLIVLQALEEKEFVIDVARPNAGEILGSVSIDLYTVVTGPVNHSLPLKKDGHVVGRIRFSLRMEQLTPVTVVFKEVKWRNVVSKKEELKTCMKYIYSKHWFDRLVFSLIFPGPNYKKEVPNTPHRRHRQR